MALVVLLIAGYVGYFYYSNQKLPSLQDVITSVTSLQSSLPSEAPELNTVSSDAASQLQTLGQRAGEVSQHAQQVLGTSIQKNEAAEKPLHQRALDYGQYMYCKQVVEEYEKE